MSKRKILIIMLILLLALLIAYLIILSFVKKGLSESSVSYPYTNWMSEPNNSEIESSNDSRIIVFNQED